MASGSRVFRSYHRPDLYPHIFHAFAEMNQFVKNISKYTIDVERLRSLTRDQLINIIGSMVNSLGAPAKDCYEIAIHNELDSSSLNKKHSMDISSSSSTGNGQLASSSLDRAPKQAAGKEDHSSPIEPKKKKQRIAREFDMSK
jgi:hypothetical protein